MVMCTSGALSGSGFGRWRCAPGGGRIVVISAGRWPARRGVTTAGGVADSGDFSEWPGLSPIRSRVTRDSSSASVGLGFSAGPRVSGAGARWREAGFCSVTTGLAMMAGGGVCVMGVVSGGVMSGDGRAERRGGWLVPGGELGLSMGVSGAGFSATMGAGRGLSIACSLRRTSGCGSNPGCSMAGGVSLPAVSAVEKSPLAWHRAVPPAT